MNPRFPQQQRGVTLLVALIMLLVLTVLTVTNMREVTLETRITANRMENVNLNNSAESALREGEARFLKALRLSIKPEPNQSACKKESKYNIITMRPCIIEVEPIDSDDYAEKMSKYILDPITTIADELSWTGADTDAADDATYLLWMPYRGTANNAQEAQANSAAYWNATEMPVPGQNSNYGDELMGSGIYYHFVTGQTKNEFALQTTIAKYYPGPSK